MSPASMAGLIRETSFPVRSG
jgi:hypothetical protein